MRNPAPVPPRRWGSAGARAQPDARTKSWSGGWPISAASSAGSILLPPHVDHLVDLFLICWGKLAELAEEGFLQNLVTGLLAFVEQVIGRDLEGLGDAGQLFPGRFSGVSVLQFPDVALARVGQLGELVEGVSLFLAVALDLRAEGRGHSFILVFLGFRTLVRYAEQKRVVQVDSAICSVYIERLRIAIRRFSLLPVTKGLP